MKARGLAALSAKAELTSYEFERRELGAHDVALDIASLFDIFDCT